MYGEKSADIEVHCNLSIKRSKSVIVAELEFVNQSKDTVRVPNWILLENGEMTRPSFKVTRDSMDVSYRCKMVKRLAPTGSDMRPLQTGVPFITRTKISECYDFSISGTYNIFYHSYFPFSNDDLEVKSNIVTVEIE